MRPITLLLLAALTWSADSTTIRAWQQATEDRMVAVETLALLDDAPWRPAKDQRFQEIARRIVNAKQKAVEAMLAGERDKAGRTADAIAPKLTDDERKVATARITATALTYQQRMPSQEKTVAALAARVGLLAGLDDLPRSKKDAATMAFDDELARWLVEARRLAMMRVRSGSSAQAVPERSLQGSPQSGSR